MFHHQKMFGYIWLHQYNFLVYIVRHLLKILLVPTGTIIPTLGCTHCCILHTIAFCSCVLGTCNISLTNPFWSTVLCLQLLQLQTWGILWIILSYLFWDLIRSFGENMDMRRQVVSGYVMCWVSAIHSHFIGLNFGAPYLTRDLLLLYVPPLDIFRK